MESEVKDLMVAAVNMYNRLALSSRPHGPSVDENEEFIDVLLEAGARSVSIAEGGVVVVYD